MKKSILPTTRPTNEDELFKISRKAYELAMNNQYEEALIICEWLIAEPFSYIEGLRSRAEVFSRRGDNEQAILDWESILATGVEDPGDMFSVVMLYIKFERNIEAELVCDKGIKVSLETDNHFHLSSLRMLKAKALLRQFRAKEALVELEKVPDDGFIYMYGRGVRTKADMIVQAHQIIEQRRN
jgi:hypothetical protein